MKELRHSLYWKLAGLLLIILTLLSIVFYILTVNTSKKYFDETTQQLNENVAAHLLQEVPPFKNGIVNEEALGKIMHSMMAVNPNIEVYLLGKEGEILSFVVLDKKVKLKAVNLAPIKEYLQHKKLVYGDNPRLPGKKTIFSVSPVVENNDTIGYVYLTLNSEQNEEIAATLKDSFMLTIAIRYFAITLIATAIISLLLLWLLVRNLSGIMTMIKQFSKGDHTARVQIYGKGELANVALSCNQMADKIVANIEQLKEVDTLRRELIANISHDLRTPVAIIHGYAETLVMKAEQLTNEKQQEYIGIIISTAEKLKILMADLFELSKLEAKQIKPQKEPFQIIDLLMDMSNRFKILSAPKNINFNTSFDKNLPLVYADLKMIERVLQNLVDNAIKFTPINGEIAVKVAKQTDGIKVAITNNGNGIAKDDLPKIFSRYYKTNNSVNNSGTGLGLAIVKNILELHNVAIEVESIENEFTTFSFLLKSEQLN